MARFLALAALLIPTPLLAAADRPAAGTPVGGLGMVSVDQKTIFLPAKDGGIEAVDLATGKVVWTNKDASKVAGASDKLVLAWTGDEKKPHAFRVIAIDSMSGKTVVKSDPIPLPDWAMTTKTWGRTFRTGARMEGEAITVAWQANAFYSGGARPPPEIEAAARKEASAIVTIDLKTGKVATADRKPKDDDYKAGPAGGFNNKVGGYEFRIEEQIPGFKPGAARLTKVTLTVVKDGKELWKRELAGNPWSPPPP